mgnify:CR=1 FL=1
MVTIVIISILAAIAIPSYRDYVVRGALPEAFSTLSAHRVKMEQFFQDNRTYAGACTVATRPRTRTSSQMRPPKMKHFPGRIPEMNHSSTLPSRRPFFIRNDTDAPATIVPMLIR